MAAYFSVVIPTYNRADLVGRAITSVLRQGWPDVEIVVVDDASSDGTEQVVRSSYPQVRYLRQGDNQGGSAARQRGIKEATGTWVFLLDDDDEMCENALQIVASELSRLPDAGRYPVVQFASSNGSLPFRFKKLDLDDYLSEVFQGDLVPVIQRDMFLREGLSYAANRQASGGLLWWAVAEKHGMPTWDQKVIVVHTDATNRTGSVEHQIRNAAEFARLQEMTLDAYGDVLQSRYPRYFRRKHIGAAVYWLLAGEKGRARAHLARMYSQGSRVVALSLYGLSLCPALILRLSFRSYRYMTV